MQYFHDMKEELQKLINSFDYKKALEWYLQHIEGKFFIKEMLQTGEDAFNILKLKKELNIALETLQFPADVQKLDASQPKTQELKRRKESSRNILSVQKQELEDLRYQQEELESELENLESDLEEMKEKLQEKAAPKIVEHAVQSREEHLLDEEWKPLFKEANHYFVRLDYETDTEKRKQMAFKVLDLMDEVEEIWYKKDFMRDHGQLPDFENAGADQLTTEQVATRIRTLRTYISKARKGKLNALKIPEWEAEIADMERRIRL